VVEIALDVQEVSTMDVQDGGCLEQFFRVFLGMVVLIVTVAVLVAQVL
jgi:hypothetical protein